MQEKQASMISPSINELTEKGKINRYELVVATAKAARIITDEYVRQREYAEKIAMSKEGDKNKHIASYIKKEYRDEKAVKNAIMGLYNGEFRILSPEEAEEKHKKEEAEEAARREARAKELERMMQAQAAEDAAAAEAEEDDTDFDEEDDLDDLEPSAEDLAAAEDFEKDL